MGEMLHVLTSLAKRIYDGYTRTPRAIVVSLAVCCIQVPGLLMHVKLLIIYFLYAFVLFLTETISKFYCHHQHHHHRALNATPQPLSSQVALQLQSLIGQKH